MASDDILENGVLNFVLNALTSDKDIYLQDRVECDIGMFCLKRRSWWINDAKKEWNI